VAALRTELEVAGRDKARTWTTTDSEMLDEVARMESLIDDLLVLARSDASSVDTTRTVLDFDDVVLAEVRRARDSSPIRVDVGVFQPGRVLGHEAQLGRAVRNILENGQRHASSALRVDLTSDDETLKLIVDDDGPGVAPEDRERIFERFTRLDGARDREHGGTGLGLAIARDLLRAHGGDVTVEDGPPSGARFVVTLPRL
jgi:signal transduction histidine kinase